MNFQTIPPIPTKKHLIDQAFKRAREKGTSKKLTGNWLQIIRKKEALKLDIIKESLTNYLNTILKTFPQTEGLPQFYQKLMKLTLDFPDFKKSLGAINWAIKKISFFHRSYVSKVVKEKNRGKIKELMKQFYGRISSVIRQIDDSLQYLEHSRKIMKTYPDIKEMFTVCLYGFPNVGKTTLLNKLTDSKAKVAAYAFTTIGINAGYISKDGKKIQLLDVPGTLARHDKMNDIELQAELVLTDLADVIVFVLDPTETSGYSIKEQQKLMKKIKDKKVFLYLSKLDLMKDSPPKMKYYNFSQLKEKLFSLV